MKIKIAVLLVLFAALGGSAFAQNNARMLSIPNSQTGTSYTFVAADTTRVVTFNNAGAIAATLPNGATFGFGSGTMLSVVNIGAGSVTITCSSCTITANGTASTTLGLATGQGADIYGGIGGSGVNYVALPTPSGANAALLNASNTFSGAPQSVINAGVFTNTQQNDYLISLIGGINIGAQFLLTNGGHATEAVAGGVSMPVGSTVTQASGGAFYANTSANSALGTVNNAVGIYSSCLVNAGTTGAACWGANHLVQDSATATGSLIFGDETDINLPTGATPSRVFGLLLTGAISNGTMPAAFGPGANSGTGGAAAIYINAPRYNSDSGWTWPVGFVSARAATPGTAVQIDGTCNVLHFPCSSQLITATGYDGANAGHTASLFANSAGVWQLNSAGGGVAIGGGSTINKLFQANATLTYTAIAAQTCQEQPLTMTGATQGVGAWTASPSTGLGNTNLTWSAYSNSAANNQILVRVCNPSSGSITPNAVTWYISGEQ